jgi:dTDP-4-amino-4,6-dideoxygalactose transaminase
LNKLKNDLQKRLKVRQEYLRNLQDISEVIVPFSTNKEFVSNYIFPIILKNSTAEKREMIRNKMHECGIQTSNHYPAVHRFSIYREFDFTLPVTEYVADNVITLPMYANLSHQDISYVCSVLKKVIKEL